MRTSSVAFQPPNGSDPDFPTRDQLAFRSYSPRRPRDRQKREETFVNDGSFGSHGDVPGKLPGLLIRRTVLSRSARSTVLLTIRSGKLRTRKLSRLPLRVFKLSQSPPPLIDPPPPACCPVGLSVEILAIFSRMCVRVSDVTADGWSFSFLFTSLFLLRLVFVARRYGNSIDLPRK